LIFRVGLASPVQKIVPDINDCALGLGGDRSRRNLTLTQGSSLRDARALIEDACDVCDAGMPQEYHGRCATEHKTNDYHHSTHGNDGAAMELPTRAADNETLVRYRSNAEKGGEDRRLG